MDGCIPLALQIVIDDVGWWSGRDDSAAGGPYRNNLPRNHTVADYRAIVELGIRLGMRPQAAFILCEWDRANWLRDLPTGTWQGRVWDNSRWVGPWLDEAAQVIRDGRRHLELTLHGVGHEYWHEPGVFTRAEWHDRQGGMRPRDQIEAHLWFYARLLEQNQLGAFPESFVPAAFLHHFGLGPEGIAPILVRHGIKYLSTPFSSMHRSKEPQTRLFGLEEGLLALDRGSDLFSYHQMNPFSQTGPVPSADLPAIKGAVCGMHWSNLLHVQPERNPEVIDSWVAYLQANGRRPDRMLAADTAEAFSQAVYATLTGVERDQAGFRLDFTRADQLRWPGLGDRFYFKTGCDLQATRAGDGLTGGKDRSVGPGVGPDLPDHPDKAGASWPE